MKQFSMFKFHRRRDFAELLWVTLLEAAEAGATQAATLQVPSCPELSFFLHFFSFFFLPFIVSNGE